MAKEERCICCNSPIPEGRQVCRECEIRANETGGIYKAVAKMDNGKTRKKYGAFLDLIKWIDSITTGNDPHESHVKKVDLKA